MIQVSYHDLLQHIAIKEPKEHVFLNVHVNVDSALTSPTYVHKSTLMHGRNEATWTTSIHKKISTELATTINWSAQSLSGSIKLSEVLVEK